MTTLYNASGPLPVKTVLTTYPAVASDYTILADATSGPFTVTLLAPANSVSKILNVKKIDSTANVVSIVVSGGALIDGVATVNLSMQYQYLCVQSDGTGWNTI